MTAVNQSHCFALEGPLDFEVVPQLLKKGLAHLRAYTNVTIDFSNVTDCTSAGLALILEWFRYARKNGITLTLIHIPAQLTAIAGLCGIDLDTLQHANHQKDSVHVS